MPCRQTTCFTLQSGLIWVYLQQPSWTLTVRLHDSALQQGTLPLCCFFASGNRERGLANMVGTATAAPRSLWESRPLLLLCTQWRFHDEENGHGVMSLGGVGPTILGLRETVVHMPVRGDCLCVLKRNRGDDAWVSEERGSHFYSVSCVISGSDTKMIVQYGHGRCRFDVNTFLNLSSPDYFFRCLDVCTITAVADVPHRFSLWKLSLPRLVSLNRSKRPGFWTEHSCQEVAWNPQRTSFDVRPS